MTELVRTSDSAPAPPNAKARLGVIVLQGTLLLGESVAFIWLIDRLASADWTGAIILGQFVLAMFMLSLSLYCTALRKRDLYDPLSQLEILLPQIRNASVSPDELSGIRGRLGPLSAQLLDIFRDLRLQKMQLHEMDHEVTQRIANRTEALERKIGSLRHQATRDSLTGLLNRRAMDEHLAKTLETCAAASVPVSVLMIDVDNFKPLNDTLGHAAGDELLRSIGQLLRSTLRGSDAAFRCGGDEFVLILQGADSQAAQVVAEHLTLLVDGLVKTLKVPALPRLSIGGACITELAEPSAPSLLEEADKRLYSVKKQRKSRSVTPQTTRAGERKSA